MEEYDLEELLKDVENIGPEVDWGEDVGRERWWEEESHPS